VGGGGEGGVGGVGGSRRKEVRRESKGLSLRLKRKRKKNARGIF